LLNPLDEFSRRAGFGNAMRSFEPIDKRCVSVGLMILASSIGLRWFSSEPWVGKATVLLGLHVAAMALLSAGAIGVCHVAAFRMCAFWAAGGALLELLQHRLVAVYLLPLLPQDGPAAGPANFVALFLVNGAFTTQEVAASVIGGALGFVLIRKFSSVRESSLDGQVMPPPNQTPDT
jgi:hypothetical protein